MSETETPSPPTEHTRFRPRPFEAAVWLRGAHLQTIGGKLLRPRDLPETVRTRVRTPDQDFVDIDRGPDPGSGSPIILVLHGLEGSTRRGYVRVALAEIERRGMLGVALNFRSCSGEPNLRPRFYHSGETTDMEFVIEWIADRFPHRRIGALGFSLGGNVLLRHLGERAGATASRLSAAAAISVPFDLDQGARRLDSPGMGRLYTRYFLRSLQDKTRRKEALLRGVVDVKRILAARTIREFDEAATAPLHEFASAGAYYRDASSGPILTEIRVPTLLLHALDDPFLPRSAVPAHAVRENPWLAASFPETGGHVGFVEGATPWRAGFWAESEAVRYLSEVLRR